MEEEKKEDKKKETGNNVGDVYERSEKVSGSENQSDQPTYLDEIILETVKEKISQTNNVILPPLEDMKKLMEIHDTVENMVESRKKKPTNKEDVTFLEE